MKVLQINSHFTSGGPPRIVNGIYDTLTENGHSCKIAAARKNPYTPIDSITIGFEKLTYINALKARLFDNEGFNAGFSTKRLIRDIISYSPDIIHIHNLHGYYINVEELFSFLKDYNRPVVWTLHDMWAFSGHCGFCDMVNCEKWKDDCLNCPGIKEYPRSYIDRAHRNLQKKKELFSSLDKLTIVTPSKWLADCVKQSFLNKNRIEVIYNGIDTDKFHPTDNAFKEEKSLSHKRIILGVAAVWDERKGYSDFIKLSRMIDKDTVIVMVGLKENQIQKLPDNIIGIKKTENIEALADIYSSADIFANLTYSDNFPTTNIEALACGTPVLTYETGGSPESITDTCGWVINRGDLNTVLSALEKSKETAPEDCINQALKFERKDRFSEYIKLYEQSIY